MPPEIADSDAESDIGSPIKQIGAPENRSEDTCLPQNSPSVIDFDQFLDLTQRLSSSVSHRLNSIDQLDGADDPRPDGLTVDTNLISISEGMPSAVRSKKRAHSAMQGGVKDPSHDNADKSSKSKRSKTYSTKSKSRLSDDGNLFALPPAMLTELENPNPTSSNAATTDQQASEIESTLARTNPPAATSQSSHTRVISLLGQSATDATPLMTTSMASMGQYQSINLDFRSGFDVNANPFGSPSQVSVDGDPHQAEKEVLPDAGESLEQQLYQADTRSLGFDLFKPQPLPATSQTSPDRPSVVNPAELMKGDNAENVAGVVDESAEIPLPSMEKPPPPKKRGRKAKNSRLNSKSPAPSLGGDADELALQSLPRSRQGTVDSVSHASDMSAPVTSTRKRTRGKSKQVTDSIEAESSPVKLPTSEPNLSDEAFVGLPKEAYKPRPSRSRSKIIVEDEPQPQPEESSSLKEPTSELGMNDETVIGLPKENYKPRPSLSRSKKTVDEELPDLPPPEAKVDHRTPTKSAVPDHPEEETPIAPSTKSSTKKGRKSKVKRAKTSAAALLKKTDPMLSEGEEDVVWMDTKPTPVKLDLPPDLKALKKEPDPHQDEEDVDDVGSKPKTGKSVNVTVEIPNNAEAKNPVAEPKKRGRKPKKAQQKSAEQITAEEGEEQEEQHTKDSRPALAEKSTNIRATIITSATSEDPKKTPTVSPITSPEPEVRPQPAQNNASAKDKENQPVTTPAKPISSAPPSSEKGPTKHSPINPPSATNSGKKVIYRVGLSRRQHIPSLLRKVDRGKPPPKNVTIKQKELKPKKDGNHDGEEGGGDDPSEMRGADGMLVEWEF